MIHKIILNILNILNIRIFNSSLYIYISKYILFIKNIALNTVYFIVGSIFVIVLPILILYDAYFITRNILFKDIDDLIFNCGNSNASCILNSQPNIFDYITSHKSKYDSIFFDVNSIGRIKLFESTSKIDNILKRIIDNINNHTGIKKIYFDSCSIYFIDNITNNNILKYIKEDKEIILFNNDCSAEIPLAKYLEYISYTDKVYINNKDKNFYEFSELFIGAKNIEKEYLISYLDINKKNSINFIYNFKDIKTPDNQFADQINKKIIKPLYDNEIKYLANYSGLSYNEVESALKDYINAYYKIFKEDDLLNNNSYIAKIDHQLFKTFKLNSKISYDIYEINELISGNLSGIYEYEDNSIIKLYDYYNNLIKFKKDPYFKDHIAIMSFEDTLILNNVSFNNLPIGEGYQDFLSFTMMNPQSRFNYDHSMRLASTYLKSQVNYEIIKYPKIYFDLQLFNNIRDYIGINIFGSRLNNIKYPSRSFQETHDYIKYNINATLNRDNVKALVLRINNPEELVKSINIREIILEAKKKYKKPIYASIKYAGISWLGGLRDIFDNVYIDKDGVIGSSYYNINIKTNIPNDNNFIINNERLLNVNSDLSDDLLMKTKRRHIENLLNAKISKENIDKFLTNQLFTANEVKNLGIVDEILDYDDVITHLNNKHNTKIYLSYSLGANESLKRLIAMIINDIIDNNINILNDENKLNNLLQSNYLGKESIKLNIKYDIMKSTYSYKIYKSIANIFS